MEVRATTFMNISSTNSSRFRSKSVPNFACQSDSMNTETQSSDSAQCRPATEVGRRMAAMRRDRPGVAGCGRHQSSRVRLPIHSLLLALFRFSSSQQQQPKSSAAPPWPSEIRRRLARSPPQKRDCQLDNDSTIAYSTSSTF